MATDIIYYNGFKFIRYPNSKNWSESKYYSGWVNGKKKRIHRYKYEFEIGSIEKGMHIHHIDENTLNNEITNLEKKKGFQHLSEHSKQRFIDNPEWAKEFHLAGVESAKEWHGSELGIEWHKQHAKNNSFGVFDYGKDRCEECNSEYDRKTKATKFCSNKCKTKNRSKSGIDNIEKECIVCKNKFIANKYARPNTCSRICGRKTIKI